MTTIDRKNDMTTLDQTSPSRSALSPFFIAAVAMTVALIVVAAVVAVIH